MISHFMVGTEKFVPEHNVQTLRTAEFEAWQRELLPSNPKLYKVRKWGEPIMVSQGGFSVHLVGTSNFQAVKLWSPEGGWGGVTNYLTIGRGEISKLVSLQIEDEFQDKQAGWSSEYNLPAWHVQKMRWLCKDDGTIYLEAEHWNTAQTIRWGTIALGGNLVTVEEFRYFILKLPNEDRRRSVRMARVRGFRKTDLNRPTTELLKEGLIHRCFCAYSGNGFGETPKGIVYSPFWSPLDWNFSGVQPTYFWLPSDWLTR